MARHAVPLADRAAADAARPPAALPGALLRLGLRPRPVGQPGLDDRLRAPPQPRAAASTPRTRSSRRCSRTSRRRPSSRPRSSPPTAPAGPLAESRDPSAASELGLRENLAQFSLLVAVNAFVGAMVGLERSTLPLIGARGLRPRLERRGALVHRRLRAGQGVHQPRRRRARRARRPPAAADRRLGGRAAGAAADRRRAELGLDRRRQRPARRQPGPRLVDDRGDEDRPRRARAPRPRARAERGGRLRRRRARRRR